MSYALFVNSLSVFLPGDNEDSETMLVRLDQWMSKNNHHPEQRFVILESLTGERYATTFPQEVAILGEVSFTRSGGRNQIRSQFPSPKTGELKAMGLRPVNGSGEKTDILYAREYLLYEQQADERWMLVEYDGKKLPR